MGIVTVNGGAIGDTYRGTTLAPVLRIFLSGDMTTAESTSLVRSDPERGEFYKLIFCTVNVDQEVIYPSFTLHSTTDALVDPDRAKYVMALYTPAGQFIQHVAARIQVPPEPSPTTLAALVAFSANYIPPPPGASFYSRAEIDLMIAAIDGLSEAEVNALIDAAIANLISGAPGALDTLNELAAALGDDPNFATSIATVLNLKVEGPLAAVDGNIPIFDGATGRVVADSGVHINDVGGGGATELDDLTDVDLTSTPPSDGDVMIFDSGSGLWLPGAMTGGGGGAVPTFAGLPPSAPSAYDDEFNAGTLDPKWTQSTSGTAPTVTINQYPADSCFRARFGSANGMVSIMQPFVPGASPFSVTFKVSARGSANFQGWQFFLRDSTTGGIRLANYFASNGVVIHSYPSFSALNSPQGPLPGEGVWNYIHVERDAGSAWKTYWSRDGVSWGRLDAGITLGLTVTRVELLFDQSGAAIPFWAACDWIRFNAMFL